MVRQAESGDILMTGPLNINSTMENTVTVSLIDVLPLNNDSDLKFQIGIPFNKSIKTD